VAVIGRMALEQYFGLKLDTVRVGGCTMATVTCLVLVMGLEQAKLVPVQVTAKVADVRGVFSGGLTVGLVQFVQDSQEAVPGVMAVQDTVPPLLGIIALSWDIHPALTVISDTLRSAIEVILYMFSLLPGLQKVNV